MCETSGVRIREGCKGGADNQLRYGECRDGSGDARTSLPRESACLRQVGDEVVTRAMEEVARLISTQVYPPPPLPIRDSSRVIFLLNGLLKRSPPFIRWNTRKLFNTKTKANLT